MSDEQDEPLDLIDVADDEPEVQDDPEEYTLEIEGEESDDDDSAIEQLPEDQRKLPAKLREKLRDEQREKHELRRQLEALKVANSGKAPEPLVVGDKPTLESCDWDEGKYEADLTAWHERRRAAEGVEADTRKAQEAAAAEDRKYLDNYVAKKAALPIAQDKKDAAEKLLTDTLPLVLQNALVRYTDDPAKVAVALANAPGKLAALASEKDPIRFIIAVREMEGKIMVNKRKPPAPESATIVRGSAPVTSTGNKAIEKLEAEAARTGDRSKLIAARAKLRAA